MDTAKLKSFAQNARRNLMSQTSDKIQRVLDINSLARRSNLQAVQALEAQIEKVGLDTVVDQVAYFWFNRLSALRFMDANGYTKSAVVSIAEGSAVPQILADAESGFIDLDIVDEKVSQKIFDLLQGRQTSLLPQEEAYGMLLVAACNYWYKTMPFLFQSAGDYTELLMPDNLLAQNSILSDLSKIIADDDCQDVEVIGWLYQYYISEKKDQVFEEMKKNKKISPEKIPAATQLFTPHWIVKYLVENSLGRLWMLNHPNSSLKDSMEYYIAPQESEQCDFIKISSPEELKVCDPACGSGHMLTYAFDLLYLIYEEQGYAPSEISKLILENNLFGIEIDERAGELAAFALNMKARSKDRRFFRREVKPHICVLRNIEFSDDEIDSYIDTLGRDLFTINLQTALRQFEEADNFGSLIRPIITDVANVRSLLKAKNMDGEMFLADTHKKVLEVLKAIDYLSPRYNIIIVNPPYLGSNKLNPRLVTWLKKNYVDSKSDLFSAFIERSLLLGEKNSSVAMVTMQSWMFVSSYEDLRKKLLSENTVLSMAHVGARGFDSIGGDVVSTTAFVLQNSKIKNYRGAYLRLVDGQNELEKQSLYTNSKNSPYRVNARYFAKIPGNTMAYWLHGNFLNAYENPKVIESSNVTYGAFTCDNARFLKFWHEVDFSEINFSCKSALESKNSNKKWYSYNKGGSYRKWFGNLDYVINFKNFGEEIRNYRVQSGQSQSLPGQDFYFNESLSWSKITTGKFTVRRYPAGTVFDIAGPSIFPKDKKFAYLQGFLTSTVCQEYLSALNPTINFQISDIEQLPIKGRGDVSFIDDLVNKAVAISKDDWNSVETSWGFRVSKLLALNETKVSTATDKLVHSFYEQTNELACLEKMNNEFFASEYGLTGVVPTSLDIADVTLSRNPYHRYGYSKTEEELRQLLISDVIREFVSYAVGCMFGRYSIDKEGLVLANHGDGIDVFNELVPNSRFEIDKDNCIPLLDGSWFEDDIVERFREFLRVTFGEEHFAENLAFIEKALNVDGKAKYSIRDYFVKDFYKHHVSMYKKRPIYWLFESPKGAFRALIYMHRYRPETVSVVLNEYLRNLCQKYEMAKSHQDLIASNESSSAKEKAAALKESAKLAKQIKELKDYENEVLYPLAQQQIAIDLDDGVKVNYCKFGKALKKIAGLESKDE